MCMTCGDDQVIFIKVLCGIKNSVKPPSVILHQSHEQGPKEVDSIFRKILEIKKFQLKLSSDVQ